MYKKLYKLYYFKNTLKNATRIKRSFPIALHSQLNTLELFQKTLFQIKLHCQIFATHKNNTDVKTNLNTGVDTNRVSREGAALQKSVLQ